MDCEGISSCGGEIRAGYLLTRASHAGIFLYAAERRRPVNQRDDEKKAKRDSGNVLRPKLTHVFQRSRAYVRARRRHVWYNGT